MKVEPNDVHERALIERQQQALPALWCAADRLVLRVTEFMIFIGGGAFVVMISMEVTSRYLFDFSIAFANAAARMLLVWFFLLGAGLALRRGAHVGFLLLVQSLGHPARTMVVLAGRVAVFGFVALMLWSGLLATRASVSQTDPGLGISTAWGMAALPVGFAMLAYHLIVLATHDLRRRPGAEGEV